MGALGTKTDSAQLLFTTLPEVTEVPLPALAKTQAGSGLSWEGRGSLAPFRTGFDGTGSGKVKESRDDHQTCVSTDLSC